MKNNNTKKVFTQQQNSKDQTAKADTVACIGATARFLKRFKVIALLGECGAYKAKGVPISVIMLYIFNLMFSPMSMYYQIKLDAFNENFSKNTIYRFLGNIHMNWHLFLLRLSSIIIRHIASLTAYVHNHLQDRQPEIEHYLTQMTKTTERLDFADKTGHPITDIILHQTRQQAKRQGTEFTAAFHYPADREFDIYDISVILNNGLKNALEACAKIPPPAGIEVRSYSKGSLFFIEIENDFAGELVFSENDELPCTTKRDKERHGIGLANITRCAEKYQGSVEAAVVQKENRQRFCLTVMLYH